LEQLGEGQDDFLLGDAVGAARSGVDAAMAWIEHDHVLRIWGARRSLRQGGSSLAWLLRRLGLLERGLEGLLVRGHKNDDESRRLVIARLEHKGLVDQERSTDVDDDARLPWRKQPIAVGRDEAPLLFADAVRHLKVNVRGIDDDAVGVAKGKDVDIDLLRKIGDEASTLL